MTDRIPLILDVDTGIDDSLALLYAAASPEAELVAVTCLSGNVPVADVERNIYGAFVHDPFVVACTLDPSLVRTEPAAVDVDASGGPADGATIADWRGVGGRAANVDVATEGDAETFLRRLVERVGALAAGRPPA